MSTRPLLAPARWPAVAGFGVLFSLLIVAPAAAIVGGQSQGSSSFPWSISMSNLSGNFPYCSATLIRCGAVLTAAHCVCNASADACGGDSGGPDLANPGDITVYMQSTPIAGVSSIQVHPDYVRGGQADVAVLTLDRLVDGIRPALPSDRASISFGFGSEATIAGWGISSTQRPDAGILRSGQITTTPCDAAVASDDTHICWDYPGVDNAGPPPTDANSCPGDSGGPLFVQSGLDFHVLGVGAPGAANSCQFPNRPIYSAVSFYLEWILQEAGEDDDPSCGPLPNAGEAGTAVTSVAGDLADTPQGSLDAGGTGVDGAVGVADALSFEVPPGTSVLRVNLNGAFLLGTDLDLAIREGAPPTPTEFDCAPALSSSFESCEIEDPTPGTWHGIVSLAAGPPGPYQVTVTTFLPEPGVALCLLSGCLLLVALTGRRRR